MISPFDLHVLSTPPAFILSQDQTLDKISKFAPQINLMSDLRTKTSLAFLYPFFNTVFWFVSVRYFSEKSFKIFPLPLYLAASFSL